MIQFDNYLETIENIEIRKKLISIFEWIESTYEELEPVIKWNKPMYIHHGTFIIGFSSAKKHINIAPEEPAITKFENKIKKLGYSRTKMLIQIKENQVVDYRLLKDIVDFVMIDKRDIKSFWR